MELYIYDKSRRLAGVVESYEYFRWTRRYSSCGSFELRAVANAANLALLTVGNIVWKSDDEETGLIEYVELTMKDENEFIQVRGFFASSYLFRRIVWGTEILSGDIGEAVKRLLDKHVIAPEQQSRKMIGFACETSEIGFSVNTQVSYRNVLSVIESLCEAADTGYKTVWNRETGDFVFKLYKGGESQAVFSKEYDNLNAQTYVQSALDYQNVALIGGEGEGEQRVLQSLGDAEGEERRELFVDARDLREDDFGGNYAAALTLRGRERLAERKAALAFDAVINPHGNLLYKRDFDIGQIVRVSSAHWGVILRTRITEIEESYDRDGLSLQVMFGRGLLTLSQKMKEGQ